MTSVAVSFGARGAVIEDLGGAVRVHLAPAGLPLVTADPADLRRLAFALLTAAHVLDRDQSAVEDSQLRLDLSPTRRTRRRSVQINEKGDAGGVEVEVVGSGRPGAGR